MQRNLRPSDVVSVVLLGFNYEDHSASVNKFDSYATPPHTHKPVMHLCFKCQNRTICDRVIELSGCNGEGGSFVPGLFLVKFSYFKSSWHLYTTVALLPCILNNIASVPNYDRKVVKNTKIV